ncbi:MAG: aconitate hydratase AcnA [Phycisphaerales bacterium]|nr:aconitate hydratase AcnA [Phycisphaerales bacterium]
MTDTFHAKATLDTPLGRKTIYRLDALKSVQGQRIDHLPYSIKVLLESCLRNLDGRTVTEADVKAIAQYNAVKPANFEIPFVPGRVVLQDFTGVPAVVDLAAMRAAMKRMGGNPDKVNPLVPCDLVIDHSVQVDAFATDHALAINNKLDFERNTERYQFLKWGQTAFNNFRVVPPSTGIVHQVNLEYLAKIVWEKGGTLFPDSLVGTDSHTTMINGAGVLGWGVGGIEAEAVMLGQPIDMLLPEVIGFKLVGKLKEGVTATDLVLTVTQMLRAEGVVEKFVEFFGPGLAEMPLANRATIANMAPEYGATCGFFPVDEQTLAYLRLTGRDEKLCQTIEQYCKAQGLWRDDNHPIEYTKVIELDISRVEPALAGPRRPQDHINLNAMKTQWIKDLKLIYGKEPEARSQKPEGFEGARDSSGSWLLASGFSHGSVVIAAITSCTNTSNPSVMIAAGLVAKKAREKGLNRKPWVKTSLAPGSTVVMEYYKKAGLIEPLNALGFNLVGFGCTTCIGNSGPLPDDISKQINDHDLVAAAVLSGNRNFEGRINPDVKANYLASPPLVVAYALAGTVDIDLTKDPLGVGKDGKPVYLKDLWPTSKEIEETVLACVTHDQFVRQYADVFKGPDEWRNIQTSTGNIFQWDDDSTYVQEPPFFVGLTPEPKPIAPISSARVLAYLGDSVTTDHISPAGSIKKDSPAGKFLISKGVAPAMFNSYGSRRGDYRVMTRGTFANTRVKNKLVPPNPDGSPKEGGWTTYLSDQTNTVMSIFDASVKYQDQKSPLIILAGRDYGMGSSRDWAAKGTFLLGVKAVIAVSFERIHRSNLVGMGVLPLTFKPNQDAKTLSLDGTETYTIAIDDNVKPRQTIQVTATRKDGSTVIFETTCRIDTPIEVDYYRNGGILHTVLRNMAKS